MNRLIEQLIQLLQNLGDYYNQCIYAATELSTALKNKSIRNIVHSTTVYEECKDKIEDAEVQRVLLCTSIAQNLKLPSTHISVSNLQKYLTPESNEQITHAVQRLKKMISSFAEINTHNSILIHEYLTVIQKNIYLRISKKQSLQGYKKSGEKNIVINNNSTVNARI